MKRTTLQRLKDDKRPWCQATTRAQETGKSYASSSWSCPWRATTEFEGTPMCQTHRKMYIRDRGGLHGTTG